MNNNIENKISERVKELVKLKEECLDNYLLHADLNIKIAIENLNMAYGIEIKFLNDLKEELRKSTNLHIEENNSVVHNLNTFNAENYLK